jgi:acetyltransferase-like isoleucine patch superfamily enzyme
MRTADEYEFAHVGQDVTVWPLAKIINSERISIGDSVIIDDFVLLSAGAGIRLGSFVHISSFSLVTGGGTLVMEDFAGISGSRVFTGTDDFLGGSLTGPTIPSEFRKPVRSFVHIGRHAVIGSNSVILPGVTIGEGATIGANSLVTKDCDPWTVYVGSPARPLKPRPKDRILELETELRKRLYDGTGAYIPKSRRVC